MNVTARSAMPSLILPGGESIPRLGLGTWRMGEARSTRAQEVAVLRHAFAAGITLIDTAEMYGEGGAEEVLGEALRGSGVVRERLFIVSKVYPWNASREGTVAACERSLKRLGIDVLDLYLLHWRGEHPLADTVRAFEALKRAGKIRHWGVSNFDTADIQELREIPGGRNCAVNQVYYNLAKRWPEATLLPWQRELGMPTMAYSPLDQGKLSRDPALTGIARKHGASCSQIALSWLLQAKDVIAIPKSSRIGGVDEILAARQVTLDVDDLAQLQRDFPPPNAHACMETT